MMMKNIFCNSWQKEHYNEFKILHGDKSRISTDITPFNEGSFYVTHNGDMYVDMNTGTVSEPDNKRLQLTFNADIIRSEIISAIYPVGAILYIYFSLKSL